MNGSPIVELPIFPANGWSRRVSRPVWVLVILSLLCAPLFGAGRQAAAQEGQFGDPAFQRVWERTDLPVSQGRAARSWLWGPPNQSAVKERYREADGDLRLVQYLDKGRMEINDPTSDPNGPYYVTNGRLVAEMMEGSVQIGLNNMIYVGANEGCVAGDCRTEGYEAGAPAFSNMYSVSSLMTDEIFCESPGLKLCHSPAIPIGSVMPAYYMLGYGAVHYPDGGDPVPEGFIPAGEQAVPVRAAYYAEATQHNIPDVFWEFMNSGGVVYEGGQYRQGQLVDWLSTFGYPLTEPFWIAVRIGNARHLVLFQAFERRTLTYSPQNPEGWKVEMGNVGLQYQEWRNGATPSCPPRGVGHWAGVIDFWFKHSELRLDLGCPNDEVPYNVVNPYAHNIDKKVTTAYQEFERGAMLYVNRTVRRDYEEVEEHPIYVLFEDGTFLQFEDSWTEGDPVSGGMQPPAGLLEPTRGFGKVWREGAGVREKLDWAKATEQGGTGAMVRFRLGEIYWSSVPNKHFVFHGIEDQGTYPTSSQQPEGWELLYKAYDDPYVERR